MIAPADDPVRDAHSLQIPQFAPACEALTHPSLGHETQDRHFDNQRLEFLGDAVLQVIFTELLYKIFPGDAEGQLTKLRARLVSRDGLKNYAINLVSAIICSWEKARKPAADASAPGRSPMRSRPWSGRCISTAICKLCASSFSSRLPTRSKK